MALHHGEKVVIISEKIITNSICKIIEASGATGYTLIDAGGKGSRNMRSSAQTAFVVEDFANVKIEVIVKNRAMAEKIVHRVSEQFFNHYSGIAYIEQVEILRPQKF